MGAVYRARDTRLDRPVAIKVLSHDKVADPGRRQRFVLEAKAASALNHPNIVTIHDISADADGDFMVMEFIDGRTLDALIPRGGMPPARALKLAIQMADALTRAHHAGIVHRDLKPSNVMVTGNGLVKILDFGVAKLIEPVPASPDAATRTAPQPLTEVGSVVGTAAYMSPEQVEGHQLDARSDIFSFGSVLYEMATAQTAFTGSSSLAIAARVLGDEPARPRRIAASISPELEGIILRCLQKDPGRRYQTMADLKAALEDAERTAIRGVSLRLPSWRWAGATVIPVLVAAGFIVWQAQQERPTPSAPTPPVALTTFPGMEFQPTLSPESTHVAFAWNGPKQDNVDIYVQQIGAGLPLRLTSDPLNDQNPVWSPDGRWIAFLRGRAPAGRAFAGRAELRLIPPLGGTERMVTEVSLRAQPNVAHLTWCPDNSCLIVTDEQGDRKPYALFVVSLDSGEKRRLTTPPESMIGDLNPAVAPDGRSMVFQRFPSGAGAELHWVAVDERMMPVGDPRRLTSPSLNAIHPCGCPRATTSSSQPKGASGGNPRVTMARRLAFPTPAKTGCGQPSRVSSQVVRPAWCTPAASTTETSGVSTHPLLALRRPPQLCRLLRRGRTRTPSCRRAGARWRSSLIELETWRSGSPIWTARILFSSRHSPLRVPQRPGGRRMVRRSCSIPIRKGSRRSMHSRPQAAGPAVSRRIQPMTPSRASPRRPVDLFHVHSRWRKPNLEDTRHGRGRCSDHSGCRPRRSGGTGRSVDFLHPDLGA